GQERGDDRRGIPRGLGQLERQRGRVARVVAVRRRPPGPGRVDAGRVWRQLPRRDGRADGAAQLGAEVGGNHETRLGRGRPQSKALLGAPASSRTTRIISAGSNGLVRYASTPTCRPRSLSSSCARAVIRTTLIPAVTGFLRNCVAV